MSFQWDAADFDNKLRALENIDSLAEEITKEIIPELKRWTDLSFVLEADENEKPWEPLKKPRKAPPPLAGLRGTYLYGQQKTKIEVESSKSYALYHQFGTRTIPARKTLPDSNTIPRSLEPSIEQVVEKVCKRRFGE